MEVKSKTKFNAAFFLQNFIERTYALISFDNLIFYASLLPRQSDWNVLV